MWKESYRMGVELIDKQHMELFNMVTRLLEFVKHGGDNKQECIAAITFLKEYTLKHFSDEEEYQKLIGYHGLTEHRQIHQQFIRDVAEHERKMVVSDFNTKSVKDFLGTLTAWLVYHVAGDDQDIVKGKQNVEPVKSSLPIETYFYMSTCDILNKLTGLAVKDLKVMKNAGRDLQPTISVQINLDGDVSGEVTYKFTQRFAFDIVYSMASFFPRSIDEFVCSAMQEISNIISVKAVGMMSTYGFTCTVNIPLIQVQPAFLPARESLVFDTGKGVFEMDVSVV